MEVEADGGIGGLGGLVSFPAATGMIGGWRGCWEPGMWEGMGL